MSDEPSEMPIRSWRLWVAAAILAAANFVVVLDLTVANVSIPHIAGNLGISLDQGTWIITSYAVAEAVCVPLTGWLATRFGSVRLFVFSMFGFGLFSALCGLSVTLDMLIACRIGQGLCGAPLMPMSQTLLMRVFPPKKRAMAMGLWAMTLMIGPATGPIVGGAISDNWSWHWIFLLNVPIAAVCAIGGYFLLRPLETPRLKRPVDRIGLCLLIFWIGCLQIMLDRGRDRDWFNDPLIVALAIMAFLGFVTFIIWELTDEHPIVDLRIFRHRGFTISVATLSLTFGAYFASIVVIPQWLQSSMGYTATMAGLVTAFTAMASLTTSQLVPRIMTRIEPRILVSLAILWLGCMALVRTNWTSDADFWTLASPQIYQGFAMSFTMVPLMTLSMTSVEPAEMASAAGLQSFVRTAAIAIATSLSLTVWEDAQRVSHNELASKLQPDGTMAQLADAGFSVEQARLMIGNIVDRQAIMMAVDHTFLVTAGVFFLAAALIWLSPRAKTASAPGAVH